MSPTQIYEDGWWFWSTLIGWICYGKVPAIGFQVMVYFMAASLAIDAVIGIYKSLHTKK